MFNLTTNNPSTNTEIYQLNSMMDRISHNRHLTIAQMWNQKFIRCTSLKKNDITFLNQIGSIAS